MKKKIHAYRKAPTIADVAARAGVTATTVSMVMRNKPGISTPTRNRVMKIVRELDYRPSATRQTRGPALVGQIGLLMVSEQPPRISGEVGGSYLYNLLSGCLAEAQHRGNSLNVSRLTFAQVHDGQLPEAVARQHLDGLIIRGWAMPELMELLEQTQLPVVFVDCDHYLPHTTQVQIENLQAMDQLVDHLIETGADRIASITGGTDHLNAQERLAGLSMALERRGQTLDMELVIQETGFNEASGERGVTSLLEQGRSFDTLVCQNDLIALGALRVLEKRGISVPNEVRVSGFDNMSFAGNLAIPLTTVDPQPFLLGQLATQYLLEHITGSRPAGATIDKTNAETSSQDNVASGSADNKKKPHGQISSGAEIQLRVPTKLIVRSSTEAGVSSVT